MSDIKKDLDQYFTPRWAAEFLYDAHFSHLGPKDLLWEPTCGIGNMLASVPPDVPCVGTELDERLAILARRHGRPVIHGDCLTADLSAYGEVTAVFGNPPFSMTLFERLMERCARLLGIGRKAGFIVPAYFFQTSRTVVRLGRKWHVSQEMVPRDVFPGLSMPLAFGTFVRENSPMLIGFRLYHEMANMGELSMASREELSGGPAEPRGVWRSAIASALGRIGGRGSLSEIYEAMRDSRPTGNDFWREQIRKVLRKSFTRIDEGVYAL